MRFNSVFPTHQSTSNSDTTIKLPKSRSKTIPEFRTFDGYGNNIDRPTWGTTNSQLQRLLPTAYGDGYSSPRTTDENGKLLPNARDISNVVIDQHGQSIPNSRLASAWIWVWGQFIDHDLSLTEPKPQSELFPITVKPDDPLLTPNALFPFIPFQRNDAAPGTGTNPNNPRQQINELNSYIDASTIYGTDAERANFLRANDGTGKLRSQITSVGELLPFNDPNHPLRNANPFFAPPESLFIAGEPRANQNLGLLPVHTLFLREHNRLAEIIAAERDINSKATAAGLSKDEYIYQRARAIVGAEIQAITYNEFLPSFLGDNALDKYTGYHPDVNPTILNEFSNAAFRAHTLVSPQYQRINNDGTSLEPIPFLTGMFNPQPILNQGIDSLLLGISTQTAQKADSLVIDALRLLRTPDGSLTLDLPALDIQRGRDHGLPSYNDARNALNLGQYNSFDQIASDSETAQRLRNIYGLNPDGSDNVDAVDLVVGGICEDPVNGGMMGQVFSEIVAEQFTRLRDGDRFFYLNSDNPNPDIVALAPKLKHLHLSDIIRWNTDITNIQDNVFFATESVPKSPAQSGGWHDLLLGEGDRRLSHQVDILSGESGTDLFGLGKDVSGLSLNSR
ncbi:MAG TPA: peroxiredoxin [Cyanobacteria bacterium UBA11372]|nr:peroxiredoxin [Cyanobacteria bacterium UBA11372]